MVRRVARTVACGWRYAAYRLRSGADILNWRLAHLSRDRIKTHCKRPSIPAQAAVLYPCKLLCPEAAAVCAQAQLARQTGKIAFPQRPTAMDLTVFAEAQLGPVIDPEAPLTARARARLELQPELLHLGVSLSLYLSGFPEKGTMLSALRKPDSVKVRPRRGLMLSCFSANTITSSRAVTGQQLSWRAGGGAAPTLALRFSLLPSEIRCRRPVLLQDLWTPFVRCRMLTLQPSVLTELTCSPHPASSGPAAARRSLLTIACIPADLRRRLGSCAFRAPPRRRSGSCGCACHPAVRTGRQRTPLLERRHQARLATCSLAVRVRVRPFQRVPVAARHVMPPCRRNTHSAGQNACAFWPAYMS